MDANNRGKRSKDKPKDAAEGTPMKGEKEYMEEEDVSRVAVIEKELNGLKDDVNEIKALLTRLTEGMLSEGKQEIEPKEPKEETGSSQQGRRQQSPQSKLNSKKGHGSRVSIANFQISS